MLAGKSRPSVDIHIAERDLVIVTNNAWPEADAPVRKGLAKWNAASSAKKRSAARGGASYFLWCSISAVVATNPDPVVRAGDSAVSAVGRFAKTDRSASCFGRALAAPMLWVCQFQAVAPARYRPRIVQMPRWQGR